MRLYVGSRLPCHAGSILCRLAPGSQRHDVLGGPLAFDQPGDVRGPSVEGSALLVREGVALVDAGDACPRAADVPQHGLDHLQAEAETLEPGCHGPTRVMNAPTRFTLGPR